MKYRSHVLHELLKGCVQRRSHMVLCDDLPAKVFNLLDLVLHFSERIYSHGAPKPAADSLLSEVHAAQK